MNSPVWYKCTIESMYPEVTFGAKINFFTLRGLSFDKAILGALLTNVSTTEE